MSHFPLMGTPDHTMPPSAVKGPIANSFFVSDDEINAHKRFSCALIKELLISKSC